MRALITGGAGFIGSHLSERLLSLGHDVTVIDDLSTGRLENLADARENPRFKLHNDSIFNRDLLTALIESNDIVFHLAAVVGVRNIVEHPVRTIEINVRGTERVLEVAAATRKRILITSTSEVYGKSAKLPFSEADDLVFGSTTNSRWSYACSKAIDEFLAIAYHRQRGLPVTILRLFNTVGPRQTGQYGMVLPTFVKQALHGEPITVYGNGKQSRCFGHVDDVIEGMLRCIANERTAGEIFNLGSTEEVSITQLAQKVLDATGSRSRIEYIPYTKAYGPGFEDMYRRVPDISKAQEWFAYQPTHSLDEIIEDVVDYTRHQLRQVETAKPAVALGSAAGAGIA